MKLYTCLQHVFLLSLLCILLGSSHNWLSSFEKHIDSDYVTKSSLYNTLKSSEISDCNKQEVEITFSSNIVENEYIVKFKGYYKSQVRENYIATVLNSSGIKEWKIIPRKNIASKYPSDFDVVQLKETDKYQGLKALNNHPLIKTVTPQRLVHRTLKFINTTNDSDVLQYKNLKRKVNNHVSL